MLKKQKGITLIALVVTIVVLLILAGVTISLLLDENGIITKSKDVGIFSIFLNISGIFYFFLIKYT